MWSAQLAAVLAMVAAIDACVNRAQERTSMECSLQAATTANPCDDPLFLEDCTKACAVFASSMSYQQLCPLTGAHGDVVKNHVDRILAAGVKPYDVIFVTEGGSLKTEFNHLVIRATAGFSEYSHALIVSQVNEGQIMVLEAVSNVDTGNEPNGVREVAIEHSMQHVTKFAMMRKGYWADRDHFIDHTCGRTGAGQSAGAVDGIAWGRQRVGQPYHTLKSFTSVLWTFDRDEGENDRSVPDKFYCSQYVAWILYESGCAFHSGKNLDMDPWELLKVISFAYDYSFISCSGACGGDSMCCDSEFKGAEDDTRESDDMQRAMATDITTYHGELCHKGDSDKTSCLSFDSQGVDQVCAWASEDEVCVTTPTLQLPAPQLPDFEEQGADGAFTEDQGAESAAGAAFNYSAEDGGAAAPGMYADDKAPGVYSDEGRGGAAPVYADEDASDHPDPEDRQPHVFSGDADHGVAAQFVAEISQLEADLIQLTK